MSSTRRILVGNLTQSEMSEAKLLKTATVVCTIPKQLLVVVNIVCLAFRLEISKQNS